MKERKKDWLEGRKMIRSNTQSSNVRETIPIDLFIEILLRLPAKSIAICRCLSTLWTSLLVRPDFTDWFLTSSLTRPRLLLTFEFGGKWHFFSAPKPRNLDEVTVEVDYHMGISGDWNNQICLSVNGLIYLIREKKSLKQQGFVDRTPVICNPSTGHLITLPKVKTISDRCLRSFFGYDPIGKQYKVLCMNLVPCGWEYHVLTLETGKLLWRQIECMSPHYTSKIKNYGICINGILYYIAWNKVMTLLIACFDVRSEKFSFIEIEYVFQLSCFECLINYKGKIGCLVKGYHRCELCVELWVLDDTEKVKWSKHLLFLPNIVRMTINSILATDTSEIVWAPTRWTHPFYASYYNIETKCIRKVEIKGIEEKLLMVRDPPEAVFAFTDHIENLMF